MKVRFVKTRTTKNTVVYEELPELDTDERVTTGVLYQTKSAAREMDPSAGMQPASSPGPEYLYVDIQAG